MSHAVGTRRDSAHTLRAPHLDAYAHASRQSQLGEDASSRTPIPSNSVAAPVASSAEPGSPLASRPVLRTGAALSLSFPRPQVGPTAWAPELKRKDVHGFASHAAQRGAPASPLLTPRSSVACVSARSQILVPPRFFSVGCSALAPRSALVASTSTRCPNANSSGCTPAC
jgi:hypothetical protein